jgi:hypothetical protein
MVPVCDVAPDLVHPRLGRTMRDLLADLPVEPGDLTALSDLDDWHIEQPHTDHPPPTTHHRPLTPDP